MPSVLIKPVYHTLKSSHCPKNNLLSNTVEKWALSACSLVYLMEDVWFCCCCCLFNYFSLLTVGSEFFVLLWFNVNWAAVSAGRSCKFTFNCCCSKKGFWCLGKWGRVLRGKSKCTGGNFPYGTAGRNCLFCFHCIYSLEILAFVVTESGLCAVFKFLPQISSCSLENATNF